MNKNEEKLQDALNLLDENLVAEAASESVHQETTVKVVKNTTKKTKKFPWAMAVGIAASAVLVVGVAVAYANLQSGAGMEMADFEADEERCSVQIDVGDLAEETASFDKEKNVVLYAGREWPVKSAKYGGETEEAEVIGTYEETKEAEVSGESEENGEIFIEDSDDSFDKAERFLTATYAGKDYSAKVEVINDQYIEKALDEQAILKEWISATDEIKEESYTAYKVKNVSEEIVIAVRFEEDGPAFAFYDTTYEPETLGELLEAINFEKGLTIGKCYYTFIVDGEERTLVLDGLTAELLKSMLLSDTTLKNVPNQWTSGSYISVKILVPSVGNGYASMWVTEDGYLCTNLLETGKKFFIGKEKATAFKKYVLENLDGYILDQQENVVIEE